MVLIRDKLKKQLRAIQEKEKAEAEEHGVPTEEVRNLFEDVEE
jgi:hypothetical protein